MHAESDVEARLSELRQRFPLPAAWRVVDTLAELVCIAGLELSTLGFIASDGADSAFGSAGDFGAYPVDRAYFELFERISVLEAKRARRPLVVRDLAGAEIAVRASERVFPPDLEPSRLRLSLSNGSAAHELG